MTPLKNCLFVLAISVTLTPARSHAQAGTSVAVDATVGGTQGKGGEFFDRNIGGARAAASVRRWRAPHAGVFAEVSMDRLALSMGHHAVCLLSSRGGCLDSYPEFSGPAAVVGVIAGRTDRRFEVRLGVGGGAYAAHDTRVGAAVSQIDAAFFPVAHVGLIAGARWIVVPRYRGDRLSMLPWTMGIRLR